MLFCFFFLMMNKFHQILVDMELKMLFCSFYEQIPPNFGRCIK